MFKFVKRPLAFLAGAVLIGSVVVACGDDPDGPDAPDNPGIENPSKPNSPDNPADPDEGEDDPVSSDNHGRPKKVSMGGATLIEAQYDADGRMTHMKTLQGLELNISYSPIRITQTTEDVTITLSNIKLNGQGYLTGYSYEKERDEDEGFKTVTFAAEYDSEGHLLQSIESDPERGDYIYTYRWADGNLTSVNYLRVDKDSEVQSSVTYVITYGNQENNWRIYCPMWPYWSQFFTGLYGAGPRQLMSSVAEEGFPPVEYEYQLIEGGIQSMTFGNEGEAKQTLDFTY